MACTGTNLLLPNAHVEDYNWWVKYKYSIIGFLVLVHSFSTQRESNILGMGLVAVVQYVAKYLTSSRNTVAPA